jgi:hypothetical protein
MTENKNQNQNQNFLQEEENFEEELFDVNEESEGILEEEFTPSQEQEVADEGGAKEQSDDDPSLKGDSEDAMPTAQEERGAGQDDQDDQGFEEDEYQKKEEHESRRFNYDSNSDKIYLSKSKLLLAEKLIRNIKENNDKLSDILSGLVVGEAEEPKIEEESEEPFSLTEEETEEGKVIEGVFDGLNMIGPDGQSYTVPANYASKSKLVEGDVLKLTITPSGGFVYKQIQLVDRKRVVGTLQKTKEGDYIAHAKGQIWKLLPAGVTYFKGEPGDEVIFLIPQKAKSKWGAVENIIKK